ncbi:Ankyrin repeat-containing domain [Phytophthora cactorum]|nr:Ankyrin repeat-containing domain [Phytophthora cactorum]
MFREFHLIVNIKLDDGNGQTPLLLAVKLGSVEVTKLLMEDTPNSVHVIDKAMCWASRSRNSNWILFAYYSTVTSR